MNDKIIKQGKQIAVLEAKLDDHKELLEKIYEQTKLTNGRVTQAENEIDGLKKVNEDEDSKIKLIEKYNLHGLVGIVGVGIFITFLTSIIVMITTLKQIF